MVVSKYSSLLRITDLLSHSFAGCLNQRYYHGKLTDTVFALATVNLRLARCDVAVAHEENQLLRLESYTVVNNSDTCKSVKTSDVLEILFQRCWVLVCQQIVELHQLLDCS